MSNSKEKTVLLASAGLLAASLLISLLLFLLPGPLKSKRVLFFPRGETRKLYGETRFLPRQRSMEENIHLLLEEIILGPATPNSQRLVPQELEVESVILNQNTLYINFSREMIFAAASLNLTVAEMIQAVGNSVLFNFPRLKNLYVYIEGQLPDESPEGGIVFAPGLLY
jgi:hypothetical protein